VQSCSSFWNIVFSRITLLFIQIFDGVQGSACLKRPSTGRKGKSRIAV
jgi:hypothetical protein